MPRSPEPKCRRRASSQVMVGREGFGGARAGDCVAARFPLTSRLSFFQAPKLSRARMMVWRLVFIVRATAATDSPAARR